VFIPIGLPVTVPSLDDQVAVAPPNTSIDPALAATEARDPHNAETPIFVSLFIIYSLLLFVIIIHMNDAKITLKNPTKNINTYDIPIFSYIVVYMSLYLIKRLKT
jgi:hypothetical protein